MTFVLCINNKRYKRRLKLHVIYRAISLDSGLWVLDETGVMHKYDERYVLPIDIPAELAATFDPHQGKNRPNG